MKVELKPLPLDAIQWNKPGDHPRVFKDRDSDSTGWVFTGKSNSVVHPGDWIVTDVVGRHKVIKKHIFDTLYQKVE